MGWTDAGWRESAWQGAAWTPRRKATKALGDTHEDDLPATSTLAAAHEKALKRELLRAWQTVADSLDLKAIAFAASREAELELDMLTKPDQQFTLLSQVLIPRLTTVFLQGLDHGAAELRALGINVTPRKGLNVDLTGANDEAASWARQHVLEGRDNFTEAQRDNIRELISQANIEGITPDETAQMVQMMVGLRADQVRAVANFRQRLREEGVAEEHVRARGAKYADAQRRSRAQTIARTELIASANGGQQSLWDRALRQGALRSSDVRKIWIVTPDERLCPACEPLGYQAPVPIAQPFTGDGVMHPPLHPNCRCAMGLVHKDAGAQFSASNPHRTSPWRGIGNRYDPRMRALVRGRAEFWKAIQQDKSLDGLVRAVANAAGVPEGRLARTEVGNRFLTDWIGIRGSYGATDGGVMTLSPRTAKNLQRLIDGGMEAARTDPRVFQALQVVFHEMEHARSPLAKLAVNSWADIPGGANPVLAQFFEEGLAETFARRNTAALVFGNVPRAQLPSWLRTAGFYEEYVKELEYFESRIGGPGSLNRLFTLNAKSRERAAANMIQSWMGRALKTHANPKVVEVWDKLVALEKKLDPVQRVLGLHYGFASGMETMSAEQIQRALEQLAADQYTRGEKGWLESIFSTVGGTSDRYALDAPQAWKYDPFAKQLAKGAESFWQKMAELRASGTREDVVQHIIDTFGARVEGIRLDSPEVDVIPGGRAFFDPYGRIMNIGTADSALIRSIAVGGRTALAGNANIFAALNVIVHELVHAVDPAMTVVSATMMSRGEAEAERIATEAFTDMLARRYSSVLAFAGSPYSKKTGRIRGVDALELHTAYDAYLHGLRGLENRFGTKTIRDIFWHPTLVSHGLFQTYSRADSINKLMLEAAEKDLYNHANPTTRANASLLANLFRSAPTFENVIVWSTGFFDGMKNPMTNADGTLSDIYPDPFQIAEHYRAIDHTIRDILSRPLGSPNTPFVYFDADYPTNQFDAGLRRIIKASGDFWKTTFDKARTTFLSDPSQGTGDFVMELSNFIASEGKGDEEAYNLSKVILGSPIADKRGYLGFYNYDQQAIHLSTKTTSLIAELLGSNADVFRDMFTMARARKVAEGLHTVVHEAVHAARSPSPYGTSELIFMEEGLTELYTRRYMAGLLTPFRVDPQSPVYRFLGLGSTTYQSYHTEIKWFEKTFGTKAVSDLHDRNAAWPTKQGTTVPSYVRIDPGGSEARLGYAARQIKFGNNYWLARTLSNHSSDMVRQYSTQLYDVLKNADSFKIVQLWESGFFRMLDKMGFLSVESYLYHTGGLADEMRARGIPVRDR